MIPSSAEAILAGIEASSLDELKRNLVKAAIRYARIRVDWWQASLDERRDMDDERTRAHNAFIDVCNILSRNMADLDEDNTWRRELGDDRKTIGDFACHLHCLLGLKAR